MLTYAAVCCRMLPYAGAPAASAAPTALCCDYAGVCWRMLTYAAACCRMQVLPQLPQLRRLSAASNGFGDAGAASLAGVHTTICVLILLDTTIYMSSYYYLLLSLGGVHTTVCVSSYYYILLYMCPRTTMCRCIHAYPASLAGVYTTIYVSYSSSYCYICVLMLLYTHATIYVSAEALPRCPMLVAVDLRSNIISDEGQVFFFKKNVYMCPHMLLYMYLKSTASRTKKKNGGKNRGAVDVGRCARDLQVLSSLALPVQKHKF
jgi:hypothetical protein